MRAYQSLVLTAWATGALLLAGAAYAGDPDGPGTPYHLPPEDHVTLKHWQIYPDPHVGNTYYIRVQISGLGTNQTGGPGGPNNWAEFLFPGDLDLPPGWHIINFAVGTTNPVAGDPSSSGCPVLIGHSEQTISVSLDDKGKPTVTGLTKPYMEVQLSPVNNLHGLTVRALTWNEQPECATMWVAIQP